MDDKTLVKVSLIGSVIGIIVLYFAVLNINSNSVKIGEISGNLVGSVVNVTGTVESVYKHKNGHLFVNLKDETGKIKVVIWSDTVEGMRLAGVNVSEIKKGSKLQVTGTVEMYKGGMEIIPLRSQIRLVG